MDFGIPSIDVQALGGFVAEGSIAASPGADATSPHEGGERAGGRPIVLDVREPWEVGVAALDLPGADTVHIPMNQLPGRLAELDPARPILGLCHHGVRSLQCVAFLSQQGYARVYNISGGIDAWSRLVDPSVPRY